MHSSAQPTREFSVGEGLGQAGSGVLQMGAGVTGAVVGGGATLSGGGAAVGVPVCIGGVALATNGAITFYNGAKTIILAVCHWEEMPAADAAPSPAVEPASSTSAPPAQPPPSAAKPSNGAKSGFAAAKPTAEAPPLGVTVVKKKPGGTSTATRTRASPGEKPPETQTTITTSETGSVNTTTTRTKPAPSRSAHGANGGQTGSYTNTHASGRTYSGKGSRERSQVSGRRVEKTTGDQHTATEWKSAPDTPDAFKEEALRIQERGGPRSPQNYNKIESPGKKLLEGDKE